MKTGKRVKIPVAEIEFVEGGAPKGQTVFGRLTILAEGRYSGRRGLYARVRCACGTEKVVKKCGLLEGTVLSCGCFRREKSTTHGATRGAREGRSAPEYSSWTHMNDRCRNRKNRKWKDYGGRGIKVCAAWRDSFATFLADVGPKPGAEHTLDRYPNRNGDYEPGNVRWATATEQGNNTRRNRFVTVRDETLTVTEWSRRTGVPATTILYRLRKQSPEQAIGAV